MTTGARTWDIREMGMDQETAIDILRERYARGGLPLDEFRRLLGQLMATTDPVECQAIVEQLPPDTGDAALSPVVRRSPSGEYAGRKARRISAFFGEVQRGGVRWELGPETQVSATFGEAKIDVRTAILVPGENILRLHALFGEISVVVPEGLRVLIDGSARFGEVSVPGHSIGGIAESDEFTLGSTDGSSFLRIEATATFGEINIRSR